MKEDNRRFRRVSLGPEFTISFVHLGKSFARINLANISEEGCFAVIPGVRLDVFSAGDELEQLTLHHEFMPHTPIEAKVVYTLGAGDADLQWVAGIGIVFSELPDSVRRSIRDFMETISEEQ